MKPYWALLSPRDGSLFRKRNSLLKSSSIIFLFWLVLVTLSCSNKQIHLSFVTSETLNKDNSGTAHTLVVRIYQLRNKDRLEQADFKALWKQDKDVLGDDLVDTREYTLHPDSQKLIKIERLEGSNYIAVMGLFRKPDERNTWRQIRLLKGWGLEQRIIDIEVYNREIIVLEP